MKRILLLESLRGPLAIWVVVSHCIQRSGISVSDLAGPILFLRSGGNAVDVFIILSGFVIFYLMNSSINNFSYRRYIVARYFRLAPALMFFMVLAMILMPYKGVMLEGMPEGYEKTALLSKYFSSLEFYWLSIFMKVVMLHGLVPDGFLGNISHGILEPAWSISLEWQFYLVAPLIFYMVLRKKFFVGFICFFLVYAAFFILKHLGFSWGKSFLPFSFASFFVGIVSCYLYVSGNHRFCVFWAFLLVFGGGVLSFLKGTLWSGPHLALWIWSFVFLGVIFKNVFIVHFFERGVFLHFGKISYSVYLSHMPCLVAAQLILREFSEGLEYEWVVLAPLTLFLTYFLSLFSYKYIELNGIRLGRYINSKLDL